MCFWWFHFAFNNIKFKFNSFIFFFHIIIVTNNILQVVHAKLDFGRLELNVSKQLILLTLQTIQYIQIVLDMAYHFISFNSTRTNNNHR